MNISTFAKVFLYSCLVCIVSNVNGQGTGIWSLQACIEHAFKNNLQIQQSQIQNEIAKNNLLQSKLNLTPTLSGDVSFNFNFGNSIDPTTYQFVNQATRSNQFGATANLLLFSGLQQLNSISKTKNDLSASIQDYEDLKNSTALNITSLFLQIVQNKELEKVAQKQLDLSKEQYKRTMALIESGAQPAGNKLQVEAQIANDELRLVSAQNSVEISKLTLKLLLQLNPDEEFELLIPESIEPNLLPLDGRATSVYQYAEANQPGIKAAFYRMMSAKKSWDISKGAFSPNISMFGTVRTNWFSGSQDFNVLGTFTPTLIGYVEGSLTPVYTLSPDREIVTPSYGSLLKRNLTEVVGFSMNIPIFSGYSRMTNLNNAKLNMQIAELNLEQKKNTLKQDVYQAWTNVLTSSKTYEANKKNVQSLEKSYEFAKERYAVGALAPIDLSTVKNNLAIAESDLAKAKFEFIFRQKILDFYQGKPIILE